MGDFGDDTGFRGGTTEGNSKFYYGKVSLSVRTGREVVSLMVFLALGFSDVFWRDFLFSVAEDTLC
jgi:hypothetical protein